MKVKIDTAAVWDGKRREAGSVIEVPSEVWEKNSGWMKPTDSELSDVGSQKSVGEKTSSTSKTSKTSETANGDK